VLDPDQRFVLVLNNSKF